MEPQLRQSGKTAQEDTHKRDTWPGRKQSKKVR